MDDNNIINWLLEGDVSIQYQVYRDLLSEDREDLRNRIATEGWGKKFLSFQDENGHWGRKFYQPKWTSTHYTLLDLKNLGISPANHRIRKTILMLLDEEKGEDGGINPSHEIKESDVCLNGMFLNYAAYFNSDESKLKSIIDFILLQKMEDGGFNCRFNRSGARHSSLHSTLSVLEGIQEYSINGYRYRLPELKKVEKTSREFILSHRLYFSHRTNEIISKSFLKLSYPSRWKYDILRALDYFRSAEIPFDERMKPAIDLLLKKRKENKYWLLQANHPGQTHFDMEDVGKPSRWNTLRALRVIKHFGNSD
ncbi:MAG: hypothetical protein Q8N83_15440 [Ignavibacteria bacterium]|nr:hypothetical protein [Ignavibacteria bacterium]